MAIHYRGFTFKHLDNPGAASATSKKLNYQSGGDWSEAKAARDAAHFRAALLKLFGPPRHSSGLSDEAFDYVIEATDEVGARWILTAYEGASGPAIGGKILDSTCMPAAYALNEIIAITAPAEFEATLYDDDTNCTVTYGVGEGQYFYFQRRGRHNTARPGG
jgi:hypothetical protein